jgi:hypothetical protein
MITKYPSTITKTPTRNQGTSTVTKYYINVNRNKERPRHPEYKLRSRKATIKELKVWGPYTYSLIQ